MGNGWNFYLDWETVFDSLCSLSVLNREPVLKAELLPGDLERYQKLLQSLKATPDSLLPLRIPEMEKRFCECTATMRTG